MVVNETIDYSAMTVMVEGAMTHDYVGFTSPGCLSLTSNGLVGDGKGADCGEQREAVCEHQRKAGNAFSPSLTNVKFIPSASRSMSTSHFSVRSISLYRVCNTNRQPPADPGRHSHC